MTGEECPACTARAVRPHERRELHDGVLFWSCDDCGFSWPRFTTPLSSALVLASIAAAEEYEPHTRRSDHAR